MKKIIRKIMLIVIMLLLMITWNSSHQKVYASTEAEQLTMLLDQYKDDMGDIEQFRSVVDTIYNDLESATEINDELKAKLSADIDKLAEVEGINPLILNVLDVELRTQVENLTEETLPQMKEEILVIKQWADAQETTTTDPTPTPTPTPSPTPTPEKDTNTGANTGADKNSTQTPSTSTPKDDSIANINIPKAGIKTIALLTSIIAIIIIAIMMNKKYKNLRDI